MLDYLLKKEEKKTCHVILFLLIFLPIYICYIHIYKFCGFFYTMKTWFRSVKVMCQMVAWWQPLCGPVINVPSGLDLCFRCSEY